MSSNIQKDLSMTFKILYYLFPDFYYKARGDGWRAHEDLIFSRIEECYPEKKNELIYSLLA